jgi:hypothetical protein
MQGRNRQARHRQPGPHTAPAADDYFRQRAPRLPGSGGAALPRPRPLDPQQPQQPPSGQQAEQQRWRWWWGDGA